MITAANNLPPSARMFYRWPEADQVEYATAHGLIAIEDAALRLPDPHPAQRQMIDEAKRFNVAAIGRRAGKTTLGVMLCGDFLDMPVGWFSPTYKDMLEVWREVINAFDTVIARSNATERRIEFKQGGVLEFWSLDNEKAGRGRKYRRVIIDEAAFVPRLLDIWNYAIRPTLADYRGDAWIFSTPKGRNGFWRMYQNGVDELNSEWQAWQMSSHVNPYIDKVELDAMRDTMPERVYQQEIMAVFMEDGGGVFRRVMDAATAQPEDSATSSAHNYIMGVDLARTVDFTVITVLNTSTTPPSLVFMDRFNQIDWNIQINRIKAAAERFNPSAIYIDQTGVGDPIVEQLQRELA